MLSIFFFPSRLHPVLNGGIGDEDAVVAPQVPTGGLVGQTIFRHQTDRQLLDAAGVLAFGQGQVGQIDAEATITVGAIVFGVGDPKIDRTV